MRHSGIIMAAALLLTACKTRERIVMVETVRTDTAYITRHQRDSIWLHDSIYMKEYMSGDTVYLLRDRWHTQYVEKQVHDTTYIATHDTVPDPYPVEVEVPAQLTWWQKTKMNLGIGFMGILGIMGIAGAIRKKMLF